MDLMRIRHALGTRRGSSTALPNRSRPRLRLRLVGWGPYCALAHYIQGKVAYSLSTRSLGLFTLQATASSGLTFDFLLTTVQTCHSQAFPWLVCFGEAPRRIDILAIDGGRDAISALVQMKLTFAGDFSYTNILLRRLGCVWWEGVASWSIHRSGRTPVVLLVCASYSIWTGHAVR